MNIQKIEKFISLLTKKWHSQLPHREVLKYIIGLLKSRGFKKNILDNQFEFSLVENKDNIRMLHLLFWKDKTSLKDIRNILEQRGESITETFKEINERFHQGFNLHFLEDFLAFNKKNCLYPIQFGLEYSKEFLSVLKVYLSITDQSFPLKKFSQHFRFKYGFLEKIFKDKEYDSIAVDFLKDGNYQFKLYAISNNKGLLYRVELPGKAISVKKYTRFPNGLSFNRNTFKVNSHIKEFIRQYNLKIHYLTKEKGVRSFYFR